jgi:hypothetical protein
LSGPNVQSFKKKQNILKDSPMPSVSTAEDHEIPITSFPPATGNATPILIRLTPRARESFGYPAATNQGP